MLAIAIILGCIFVVMIMDQLSYNPIVEEKIPEVPQEPEAKTDGFESPEQVGMVDLKMSEHIMLKIEYETIDIFYHEDNKYALLCQTMGDKYTTSISVVPLKVPLTAENITIKDKQVFSKAKKLFSHFKQNNKAKFLNF